MVKKSIDRGDYYASRVPPGDLCAAANCRLSFVRPSKAGLIKSFRPAVTQPRLEGGLRGTMYIPWTRESVGKLYGYLLVKQLEICRLSRKG